MKTILLFKLVAVSILSIGMLAATAQAQTFTVDFSANGNDATSGGSWEFTFKIDGEGNMTVTAPEDGGFLTESEGGAVTVTGATSDSALFNTSFTVTLESPTGFYALHGSNGGWGINDSEESAGKEFRLDDPKEKVRFDWDLTGLPGSHTLQLTAMGSDHEVVPGSYTYNGSGAAPTNGTNFADIASITTALAGGTDPEANDLSVSAGTDIRLDQWQFTIAPKQ